jgi:ABC-type transport system involved in cytochrome bd biosynthesis fused ATPase/permease subunit
MSNWRRLLGCPVDGKLVAWCTCLALQLVLLRLVYPVAIVLFERAWAKSALVLATLSIGLSALRGFTADRVTRIVRGQLFEVLTGAIERYPALTPPGAPAIDQLESEISRGVPWIEALVAVTLPVIAANSIALPMIAWLSWVRVGTRATLIASAALFFGVAVGALVARHVGKLGAVAWARYQPVARLIESGFRGRIELGIHRRSSAHRELLSTAVERWSVAERRMFVWGGMTGWLVPASSGLAAIALISMAGVDPFALLQQLFGQPDRASVAAGLLALTALPALSSLSRGIADALTEWPHVEALARFACTAPDEKSSPELQPSAQQAIGAIRTEAVQFEYPSRRLGEPPTVVEANLVWQPGETLAVTGPNGCGKTTLTWLLMGALQPARGIIAIDVGGASYRPSALSGRIAYLPQQPYFEELQSVGEAIRFTAPNATSEDIERVVSALLANHFVGDVRTLLERGVMSLSVGERRVVALARVLLRRSELVILDEPEANLDGALRHRIIEILRRAKSECRMLIVTHDDAFAEIADRVYRMPSKR